MAFQFTSKGKNYLTYESTELQASSRNVTRYSGVDAWESGRQTMNTHATQGHPDWSRTFQTAGPPEAGVRHYLLVLAARVVVAAAFHAADPSRVQPVVCPHCDGHEAEGGERAHRRHEHLDAAVTHQHLHIGDSCLGLNLLFTSSLMGFPSLQLFPREIWGGGRVNLTKGLLG